MLPSGRGSLSARPSTNFTFANPTNSAFVRVSHQEGVVDTSKRLDDSRRKRLDDRHRIVEHLGELAANVEMEPLSRISRYVAVLEPHLGPKAIDVDGRDRLFHAVAST